MIELTSATAATLYLFLTLSLLLGVWGYHHLFVRKKKMSIAAEKLIVCEFCHFVYLERIHKALTQCPQCQCFNKE